MTIVDEICSISPNSSIVAVYILCPDYDGNMGLLYKNLQTLISNKFGNGPIEFSDNERIIFLHNDLDFFISDSFPGFTLYNLQLIIRELGIPNYFCTVISNLPNYTRYLELANKKLTSDSTPMRGISTHYFHLNENLINIDLNVQQITKPYAVLSRLSRFHRTYFMSKLFEANLQHFGNISYHNIDSIQEKEDTKSIVTIPNCHFLYSVPFNRNYPEIIIRNPKNLYALDNFVNTTNSFINFIEDTDIANKNISMNFQNNILQKSLIYIGLETTINCPESFITEISWKGIAMKRPFILFAVPRTLKYLQSLGFKTFSEFWDENYDSIDDVEDRVDAIIRILDRFSKYTAKEVQELAFDMQEILEYNFNHLKNNLPNLEKIKIVNGLLG